MVAPDCRPMRAIRPCRFCRHLLTVCPTSVAAVANRPVFPGDLEKATVSKGCQKSENGPEIHDFRPVFIGFRSWAWLPDDRSWTSFGHTPGHTAPDATVCLAGTRRDILERVKYFAWDDAKNAKL